MIKSKTICVGHAPMFLPWNSSAGQHSVPSAPMPWSAGENHIDFVPIESESTFIVFKNTAFRKPRDQCAPVTKKTKNTTTWICHQSCLRYWRSTSSRSCHNSATNLFQIFGVQFVCNPSSIHMGQKSSCAAVPSASTRHTVIVYDVKKESETLRVTHVETRRTRKCSWTTLHHMESGMVYCLIYSYIYIYIYIYITPNNLDADLVQNAIKLRRRMTMTNATTWSVYAGRHIAQLVDTCSNFRAEESLHMLMATVRDCKRRSHLWRERTTTSLSQSKTRGGGCIKQTSTLVNWSLHFHKSRATILIFFVNKIVRANAFERYALSPANFNVLLPSVLKSKGILSIGLVWGGYISKNRRLFCSWAGTS